jgi:hypothetical protein
VGLSEQWVAARAGPATEAALSAREMELLGEHGSWVWAACEIGERDLDELVAAVARDAKAPALGGWVADSDCAYLVFARPGGDVVARVAINETLPFGEEIEGMEDLWSDQDARRSAFEALARWADEHAPSRIDPAQLAREMPGGPGASPATDASAFGGGDPWHEVDGVSAWVFAEDGVRLVYHRLGLPDLDRTVFARGEAEATRRPSALLAISAPDARSGQPIFDRLYPRFGDRIMVTWGSDHSYLERAVVVGGQPEREPADPPDWLADAVAELGDCLADAGIDSLYVALVSDEEISIWQVRAQKRRR